MLRIEDLGIGDIELKENAGDVDRQPLEERLGYNILVTHGAESQVPVVPIGRSRSLVGQSPVAAADTAAAFDPGSGDVSCPFSIRACRQ